MHCGSAQSLYIIKSAGSRVYSEFRFRKNFLKSQIRNETHFLEVTVETVT